MKFKRNDMVLVDPENRIRNREIQGTLEGIVVEAGLFRSKVFSLQTYAIFTVPNRYLYSVEKETDLSHVTIIRDTAPLFDPSEIIELETVIGSLDDEGSKEIIKKCISKIQDHMTGNVFVEVQQAKCDTKTFQTVPSMWNYYLTDDVFEQLKNCMEARANLDAVKKSGLFKGKKSLFEQQVEATIHFIMTEFKRVIDNEPTPETFVKLFTCILKDQLPEISLDILTIVIPMIPSESVNAAYVALLMMKQNIKIEAIKDVINCALMILDTMGADVEDYDVEESFDGDDDE